MLLDLCRQCITFESVEDIARCLHAISSDPEVQICRIKNRMDPNYNSAVSAGYRDVVLNIRVSNEQTAALGIDGHVCEVQLIHTLFAELKVMSLSSY